jgi:hydroxyacylglutathione hydrolase
MTHVEIIETSGLGDRSYLATDGEVAIVIDPQRDIDRVLGLLDTSKGRLAYVLETHIHNDYVTGGLELARRTSADYVISADDEVSFDRLGIRDGDVLTAGSMRIRALHTPGHTFHHLSYVLEDAESKPESVFTGGSMLYGTSGRTDLVGPEHTDILTHNQFWSLRRLAAELPAATRVFPTHGFGSFCSATPVSGEDSTIGQEAETNPALTMEEQEYVDSLLSGLDAYPAYYQRMAPINRRGPAPIDLSLPRQVDPAELRRRIEAGEWVVDLRDRTAFAAGHLAGSLGFELSSSFVSYLGWLYRWGTPLTLIGESLDQIAEAKRELVRIGIDDLAGVAAGDIKALADGSELRSYLVSDFAGLAKVRTQRQVRVLDTRRSGERAQGGVKDSQHIPLHELGNRLDEVPEVRSGSIAARAIGLRSPPLCSTVRAADSCSSTTRTTPPRKPTWSGSTARGSSGVLTRPGHSRRWHLLWNTATLLQCTRLLFGLDAVGSSDDVNDCGDEHQAQHAGDEQEHEPGLLRQIRRIDHRAYPGHEMRHRCEQQKQGRQRQYAE